MTSFLEKAHHRREIREVWTVRVAAIPQLYQPKDWAGLQSLVMVVRVRHLWNQTTRSRSVLFDFFTQ